MGNRRMGLGRLEALLEAVDRDLNLVNTTLTNCLITTTQNCTFGGVQSSAAARTATSDGLTTGTIAAGTTYVSVTSGNSDHIVTLPAPVIGNVIYIHVGTNGCELRTSNPGTISINGNTPSAGHESALPANSLSICICISATAWVAYEVAANGAVSAVEVPA
jgi:hypothetical protein